MVLILVVTERYWPDGNSNELAMHLIVEVLRKRSNVIFVMGIKNPSRMFDVEYFREPLLSKREKPVLRVNIVRLDNAWRFQKIFQRKRHRIYTVLYFTFTIIPYAKRLRTRRLWFICMISAESGKVLSRSDIALVATKASKKVNFPSR
jgi:hypothetical protein